MLSLEADKRLYADPEWQDIIHDLHSLDTLLNVVKAEFKISEMPSVQLDALIRCIRTGYLQGVRELVAIPNIKHDLDQNKLTVEHLLEFTNQYGILFYRSQELYRLYGIYTFKSRASGIYQFSRWKKEVERYKLEDGKRILEVGSGTSDFYKVMLRLYDSMDIFLNDINRVAVKELKYEIDSYYWVKRVLKKKNNRISVVEGSKDGTGLEDQTFDYIILRNSLHHFEDLECMMTSIKRSLKPSSRLIVVETFVEEGNHCNQAYNKETFQAVMLKYGFESQGVFPIHRKLHGHVYHFTLSDSQIEAVTMGVN